MSAIEFDWTAALRRERRSEALLVLAELSALTGYVLLRRNPASLPAYAWPVLGGVTLVWLGLQGLNLKGLVGLPGGSQRYRIPSAVRAHVDPGPGLQEDADTYAERRARVWWLWVLPFWLFRLVGGRWHDPAVAVPASLLLVAGLAGMIVWYRRLAAACRRWLDDPPGHAPRAAYAAPPDQRPWTITTRQGALLVLLVLATVGTLVGAAWWIG